MQVIENQYRIVGNQVFIKEFVNLAKEIAIQDGIRKFDKRKFANMFIMKLFHWSKEKTQEAVKMLFP